MKYESPKILEEFTMETEGMLLAQSVVTEDTEIESVGQEVNEHIMPEGYIHNWD